MKSASKMSIKANKTYTW